MSSSQISMMSLHALDSSGNTLLVEQLVQQTTFQNDASHTQLHSECTKTQMHTRKAHILQWL